MTARFRLAAFRLFGAVLLGVLAVPAHAQQGVITTVAGNGSATFNGDGPNAAAAALYGPKRVALDGAGNLYIADNGNNRIRKVTPNGAISTVAGNGESVFNGDGPRATAATLNHPWGVAVGSAGTLYIADHQNHRVRKVTPNGAISTVAGTGTPGFNGDGSNAAAATLNEPLGVALDSAGNLYISDSRNNRIRKVTPNGAISTVAGNGSAGFNGDGPSATAATLGTPLGVAVDSAGNLYIADTGNNRIRKVTPNGAISTVAGNGTSSFGGDGGDATAAMLNSPADVALDRAGNLYIDDESNQRIRKVTPDGVISTVAGNGISGFGGDGGDATAAALSWPKGVVLDSAGNLYIADDYNHRVRKVTFRPASTLTIANDTPLPTASTCLFYGQTLRATGGTAPYTWSYTGSLPSGLTLSAGGVISGTCTATGTFAFTVQVRDSASPAQATGSKPFTLTVIGSNVAITSGAALPSGRTNALYSTTLAALGSGLAWNVAFGSTLPPGLALNSSGVLSGTPTQAGAFRFTIQVRSSSGCMDSRQFSLAIDPPIAAPAITTPSLPNASTCASYAQALSATGGAAPYTWSYTGSLPSGLTLSAGGVISGTCSATGTSTFTVQVRDSSTPTPLTDSRQYTITVTGSDVTITTDAALPGGSTNTLYSTMLAASGSGITWSAVAGTLPPGLALDPSSGVLSGTPTQAGGPYTFTIQARSSSGCTTSRQFSLTIAEPPRLSVTGLGSSGPPLKQPEFNLQLSSPHSQAISGLLTVTFVPDSRSPYPANDPAIQLSNADKALDPQGRKVRFTIPAGQTVAFPTTPTLAMGTVAGTIQMTLTEITPSGITLTPPPSVQIALAAPVITLVEVVRTGTGFDVKITGYSTPRQVTRAVFRFTASSGANLQTTELTMPNIDSTFTDWFRGASSIQFGSQFLYTQSFTVQGDINAIGTVSVRLVNSVDSSQEVSRNF